MRKPPLVEDGKKACTRCGVFYPLEEFSLCLRYKTTQRRSWCKPCSRATSKVGWNNWKAGSPERAAESRRCSYNKYKQIYVARRRARRNTIMAWLRQQPCMDCRQNFPQECMEFDHRETKFKAPTSCAESIQALQEELMKCDIVCANCHRIRTHARGQQNGQAKNAAAY